MSERHIDLQTIIDKLLDFDSSDRIKYDHKLFKKTAVLFPLIQTNENFKVILIKRTNVGLKHRGEMSFPGGKFDQTKDESLLDTALRETEEEIGVYRKNINIIGCMDDLPTTTRYIITPFVGLIKKRVQMIKQDAEVEKIYEIPINFFLNEKNFTETYFEISSKKFPIYRYPKYNIWGATAHLIVAFIDKIYGINLSKSGLKRLNAEELAAIEIPKKKQKLIKKKINLNSKKGL
jgi:8-oxo-dGTP pyrophosphatase MutT (NUDIX family)